MFKLSQFEMKPEFVEAKVTEAALYYVRLDIKVLATATC